MKTDPLGEKIRHVLQQAPFAMRQLAADAGLSYDVLRSWRSGRRRPSRASAARLAAGLEGRGERLLALARELRAAAEERPDERPAERPAERPDERPVERPDELPAERPEARRYDGLVQASADAPYAGAPERGRVGNGSEA
jgi:transcriptional regulator with XRE-family HTH domain